MLKKTITYVDYDNMQRTEDFYFNLSKAEVIEMEMSTTGGMEKLVDRIIKTKDTKSLFSIFKEIILTAYGEKTPDGKRFQKCVIDEHGNRVRLADNFAQTEAYSDLVCELVSDADAAVAFINAIIPQIGP